MQSVTARVCLAVLLGLSCSPLQAQEPDVDLQQLEQRIQSVLGKIRSCTVGVGGGGSGVVVSKEGHVLTCAHVAQASGRRVSITFPDGRVARATTLGNYYSADAGVVKIDNPGDYPFAEMAKPEDIKVRDWVLAVGYPVSFAKRQLPPVRIGRVTRYSRNQLVSDAPIMGGDSGGPLFNLDGKVIGINSRVSGSITSNVHVPIDQYHQNWERLLASEDWPESRRPGGSRNNRPQRPQGQDPEKKPDPKSEPGKTPPKTEPKSSGDKAPTADPFKPIGITLKDTEHGPSVAGIIVDSLAHRSHVRAGHVIISIGGVKVKDAASCRRELAKHAGKATVDFVVGRRDKSHGRITVPVRLREKK